MVVSVRVLRCLFDRVTADSKKVRISVDTAAWGSFSLFKLGIADMIQIERPIEDCFCRVAPR